uniref:Protein cereblon n=1 Tax=Arundo donax TaxID=35708 RepID=A0A0A8YSZ0_ARUDO
MAEPVWILERERRQMEEILELDMEELQVEEVDDAGSSSSSDVDTFLRNTRGVGGISTSEEPLVDTSLVSLQVHTNFETEVDDSRDRFVFLDGGTVLNLPMFYLQGVVLFPEAALPLRVIQPRLAEAIDKAINHVDAPCMIGVVRVYQHKNDGHHAIASVGTTAEIQKIQQLDDGSSCVFSRGQQRFRLRRCWLDVDRIPWGEVQIIEEDTPLRTPRDAFGQLAASNNFRQCASSMPSLHVSCFKQLDRVDSELDGDSLSPTSTSSEQSVTDRRIYLSASQSSSSVRCDILDESSNEDDVPMHEQSWQNHDSVNKIGVCGHPDKYRNSGDEDDLCVTSSDSFSRVRRKDTGHQRPYCGASNSNMASQAPLSFWPRWAYEMYDSYSLARRAADLWRHVIVNPSMDDHVRKPDLLSFYIGSKLPISESLRQELLEIDGISYRLQREIQLLKAFNIIRCRNCPALIARRSDMVMMSNDGPVATYIKLNSHMNEMIAVYNTTGLAPRGDPSKTHSWFPGYKWTIALCAACESNIGWLFRADKKDLDPKSFWAIRTSQISDDTQSRKV